MEIYDLPSQDLISVLKAKGVENLFHANTVQTSYTFLQSGYLLSRQYVGDNGLKQTAQYTDKSDKCFGVFDCIFMDTIDIHERARGRNKYGPILFRFSLDLFDKLGISTVRFTKRNPSKWTHIDAIEDRYYTSMDEVVEKYSKGNFDSMLVINESKIPLRGNLLSITIDDPNMHWLDNRESVAREALMTLRRAGAQSSLIKMGIKRSFRQCERAECFCIEEYNQLNDQGFLQQLFRLI